MEEGVQFWRTVRHNIPSILSKMCPCIACEFSHLSVQCDSCARCWSEVPMIWGTPACQDCTGSQKLDTCSSDWICLQVWVLLLKLTSHAFVVHKDHFLHQSYWCKSRIIFLESLLDLIFSEVINISFYAYRWSTRALTCTKLQLEK